MYNALFRRFSILMSIISFMIFIFFSFRTGGIVYSSGTDDISAYDLENISGGGLELLSDNSLVVFEKEYNINELDQVVELEETTENADNLENITEEEKKEITIDYYTVQKGDSLYKISKHIGQDIDVLVANNPEVSSGVLKIGQKLKILSENGIHYKVRKGDSLSRLAKRYKVKVTDIMQDNSLSDSNIVIGQKLFIKNPDLSFAKASLKNGNSNRGSSNSDINFGWPVKWRGVTSPYGRRFHPVLKRYIFHAGVDLRGRTGTPIYAPADGKIIYAGWASGYGRLIKIKHSKGYSTRYGHLSGFKVKQGDSVKRGELIGYVGKSGRVTGPHLHYEIRKNGKALNPIRFR